MRVIQQGSSNILTGLYASFIWLDIAENFIKIGHQTPEILQIFLWGVFLHPLSSLRVAKTLYL